jgi:opacity protein-like surface antigen
MRTERRSAIPLAVLSLLIASSAAAQPEQGVLVGGAAAAVTINGTTQPAIVGGIGYRLSRVFALGVEVTFAPDVDADRRSGQLVDALDFGIRPGRLILPSPRIVYTPEGGHLTVFTTNVRVEIPTLSRRVIPYVIGGGGVGSVRERARVIIEYPVFPLAAEAGASGAVRPFIFPPPREQVTRTTSTNLALTIGGGASILLTGGLSIDADLRYLRLIGSRDRDIGRFGAGLSYRF